MLVGAVGQIELLVLNGLDTHGDDILVDSVVDFSSIGHCVDLLDNAGSDAIVVIDVFLGNITITEPPQGLQFVALIIECLGLNLHAGSGQEAESQKLGL